MAKIDDVALDVANALLATSSDKFTKSWPVVVAGKPSGETVEVIVIRRRQNIRKAVILSESTTIQFHDSGRACGTCGGSGRV